MDRCENIQYSSITETQSTYRIVREMRVVSFICNESFRTCKQHHMDALAVNYYQETSVMAEAHFYWHIDWMRRAL